MALTFGAGTSDRVEIAPHASINNLLLFTVLAWIYPTTLTANRRIYTKGVGSSGYRIFGLAGTGSQLYAETERSTVASATAVTGTLTLNAWQFVGGVYDEGAANFWKLYKGSLTSAIAEVAYAAQTNGSGTTGTEGALEGGIIGNRSALNVPFLGAIASFGIWNRALTVAEMAAQQFRPHKTAGCVVLKHLGFSGGSVTADLSGTGNTGTITGATVSAHVPLGPLWGYDAAGPLRTLSVTVAGIEETLPTFEEGTPEAYLLTASVAEPPEETLPTFEEGTPTALLTNYGAAEAPEETFPTLDEGTPTARLQNAVGAVPVIIVNIYPDTGNEYVSDIQITHPSRDYEPKVLSWEPTETGIAIPPGGPIIGGGGMMLKDVPDPITGVQHLRQILEERTQRRRIIEQKLGFEGGSEALFEIPYRGEMMPATFPVGKVHLKFRDIWARGLDRVIPNVINRTNYPNLPVGIDSAFFQIILGENLSPPENPYGVVKLIRLGFDDILGDQWGVSMISCHEVVNVYRKLPDEEVPTIVDELDWHWYVDSITFFAEIPDKQFQPTYVTFPEAQPEGTEVWVDVIGWNQRGQAGTIPAATGQIDNIADHTLQMMSIMFALEPIDIPLNYDSIAEVRDKFTALGLKFGGCINSSRNFRSIFARMQADGQFHIFQDEFARMAFSLITESDPNRPVFTEAHDIWRFSGRSYKQKAELDILPMQPEEGQTFNTFNVRYAPNHGKDEWAGNYPFVNEADLEEVGFVEELPVDQMFIRDLATSQWSVQQLAMYCALRSVRVRFSVKAPGNTSRVRLGHVFGMTYSEGIGGHWINKEFLLYKKRWIPQELRYEIEGVHRALVEPPVSDGGVIAGSWAANSRVGPFFESSRRYVFGMFKKTATSNEMMAIRTANYKTFTEMDDAGFTALANEIGSFDTHRVGNLLYVATQEEVTGRVAYHVFSLNSSTWTTFNEQVIASTSHADCGVSIGVDSSGKLFIWYQSDRVFRSGSVAPASAPDGYYQRTALKRRLSAGSWTPALEIGSPDSAIGTFVYTIPYLGKVHDNVGRAIAGRDDRIMFFWGRSEPADVANTADLWFQGLKSDGTLSTSTEFQFTGGLGYTATHLAGDYATFDYNGHLYIALPVAFDVLKPNIFLFQDNASGGGLEKCLTLSTASGMTHNGVARMPSIAVRWLNGQLHALFASGWGAQETWAVYKSIDPQFDSTDIEPSWDGEPRALQAGPVWDALVLQMAAADFATIGGKLWMFAFYSLGGPQIFEAIKVEDLPIDPGYTGDEWLADHA